MKRSHHRKGIVISTVRVILLTLVLMVESHASSAEGELTDRQQAIIPIAAFTASGNIAGLENALNKGLDQGLTVNEVQEIFIHSYAYAGFPRALNGINTFIGVMESRGRLGITDTMGKESTPVPVDFDRTAYGHQVRNELVGRDISNRTTGYAAFVPTIDLFLVEHLFADIFYRDVLTHKDRELVTISMLSAMPGTEAQLRSHINLSLRVGYTPAQLVQFVSLLRSGVSQDSAMRALTVISEITDVSDINANITAIDVNRDDSSTPGSPDKFTGEVQVTSRFESPVSSHYRGAMVEFEPGARTAWHTHPKGQTLIIISGQGLVQSEGGEVQQMLPGNVITIPPDTRHWHGASEDSAMSHIAISTPDGDTTVEWMELVSENDGQSLSGAPSEDSLSATETALIDLSKQKWDWMADKNVASLDELFDASSMFVHMGGAWGKAKELEIIASGGIHYKKADIHDVSVEVIDDTAILLNRITLHAVVGEREVTNNFMVTEVYIDRGDHWALGSLSFTKLLE